LLDRTENSKSNYYKTEKWLFNKKEELFKLGNIQKWEMTQEDLKLYDRSVLINNKELAFKVMCNKVSIISEL
jgi:hypothetical protein